MINTESHVSTTNSVSGSEAVEQGDSVSEARVSLSLTGGTRVNATNSCELSNAPRSRWFINISYAHQIQVQYPVEVLDRTDKSLIVKFFSTGTVATFDHHMIRELPFDKKAPRLSKREAWLYWSKPPQR